MLEISEVAGYKISYSARAKLFYLHDAEGNEIATGPSQEALETKAKALSKESFQRIPIFCIGQDEILKGHLTSFNKDDRSGWVSVEGKGWGGGRRKVHLYTDTGYYAETPANLKIAGKIMEQQAVAQTVRAEIERLEKTLTDEITFDYLMSREGGEK